MAHGVAIEWHIVRDPEGEEHREQQQRIFRRFPERFGSLNQPPRLLGSRPGFGRGITLDVNERSYERDLELDLLATKRRRAWQGRGLLEGPGELGRGFGQRRAIKRKLSSLAP